MNIDSNFTAYPPESQEGKSARKRGMTYINLLNQFNRWLDDNNPGDKAVVLYIRMLNVFNQRYWPEWAGITTPQLMALANTSNPNVALAARDKLVEAGFIEYRPGRKGVATTYKLLNFIIKYDNENSSESDNEYCNENSTPIKSKTETKTKINTTNTETDTDNKTYINYPPNPPKGGTGEISPISSENPYSNSGGANKAESGKGRRGSRDAVPMEALSPEDESTLLSISPRLCEVVRGWITHKAESKRALTPIAKRALIEQLKRNVQQYGADIVAETIEESLANGYAGIAWSRAAQMKKAKDEQDKQLPSYGFKIIGDSDSGDYYQYYQDVQSRNAAAAEYARKVNEAWGITSDW